MIDITGLDKADVLAGLYNAAKPQGLGFMHYDPEPMTREIARALLSEQRRPYFDYLRGRVMKVSLEPESNQLQEDLYDRDNGFGAALAVITMLRIPPENGGGIDCKPIQDHHKRQTKTAALQVKNTIQDPTRIDEGVVHLGLAEHRAKLEPKVDKVLGKKV